MKNKNYLIIGGTLLIILILGGSFLLLNQSNSSESNQLNDLSNESSESSSTATENAEEITNSSSGRYVVFENGIIEDFSDSDRVLYFYANWCSTCRPVDTELRENEAQIPDNMTIIRINYNDPDTDEDEKALARRYGVVYQHTFVQIDEAGNEVTKWNGGGLQEILQNVK